MRLRRGPAALWLVRHGESEGNVLREEAYRESPFIKELSVVGVPDERLGEVPVAAVVLEPGASFDAEETSGALRRDLAAYEVPRSYVLVERIPRTDVGKPDRDALMALFAAATASSD